MSSHLYFVYMLASGRNGTLYVGVTNDLLRRVGEHRAGLVPGFTAQYGVDRLVWFETHGYIDQAILREKRSSAGGGVEPRADRGGQLAVARFL